MAASASGSCASIPVTTFFGVLNRIGHIPLPPYIDRPDTSADREQYQTVYAKPPGSVAAPTAGLHFTPEILDRIRQRGIEIAEVTLHVGSGNVPAGAGGSGRGAQAASRVVRDF